MKLNELLKTYRLKKGYTQEDVSMKLGYKNTQFVHLMEKGTSKIPYETIGKLVVILGLPQKKIENYLSKEFKNKIEREIRIGIAEAQELKL